MKVVVLCSGGMDSVTALHWARRQEEIAAVLSFDYGAKHNHREIPFAAEHARLVGAPHQVITLDFVNRLFDSALLKSGGAIPEGHYEAATMRQTVVPFRNAIMLSVATGFAESLGVPGLVIGAHSGGVICKRRNLRQRATPLRSPENAMAQGDHQTAVARRGDTTRL